MGELHLEIILDRILQEYKIPAELGKLQVAYREAPTVSVQKSGILNLKGNVLIPFTLTDTLVRTYGNQTNEVTIQLTLEPTNDTTITSSFPNKDTLTYPSAMNYEDIIKAVRNGIELACQRGMKSFVD